jgi:hypothetical protein
MGMPPYTPMVSGLLPADLPRLVAYRKKAGNL